VKERYHGEWSCLLQGQGPSDMFMSSFRAAIAVKLIASHSAYHTHTYGFRILWGLPINKLHSKKDLHISIKCKIPSN